MGENYFRRFKVANLPQYGNCFIFNGLYNSLDPRRGLRKVPFTGSYYGTRYNDVFRASIS